MSGMKDGEGRGRRSSIEYGILTVIVLALLGVVFYFIRAEEKTRRDDDAAAEAVIRMRRDLDRDGDAVTAARSRPAAPPAAPRGPSSDRRTGPGSP
jgi:hypothetical protein